MRRLQLESGQATIELIMVLPIVFALGWGVWQVSLAGRAAQLAATAARAGARAVSLGADPKTAVIRALPSWEAGRVRLETRDGAVTARLPVPSVGLPIDLGTVVATARFPVQGG
ncbi:MAG: pilus assembly protein [Solirubrobacterales bacterium]|nr:pilus assembly protein [Solirubrobacterales bacterium]